MKLIMTPTTTSKQFAGITLNNRRTRTVAAIVFCVLFLAAALLAGQLLSDTGLNTSLAQRNRPPGIGHLFGTDWLGRDMLTRTLHGLSLSLRVGLLASLISALLGILLGVISASFGGVVDLVITFVIDLFFSLPHLIMLIMIAFVLGGGLNGVLLAVAFTHWPGLARVIRSEVLELINTDYVKLAHKLGHSRWWIARHHMLPHLVPSFLVGLILLFPHAILHEAALTFIGIGLAPHTPAIGIILAESMRHLSTGYWWLAVLPGATLLLAVKMFDILGGNVRALLDPKTSQD